MTDKVEIREVGLRDGLQMASSVVPTDTKLAWCRRQTVTGFAEIEVTSFVSPKLLPQFADATEVVSGANKIPGLLASVLVPDAKGAFRAMDAKARKIIYVMSASEAHSQANTRRSTDEGIDVARAIFDERRARGAEQTIELSCIIATSFGCSIQGTVDPARVISVAEQLTAFGADEINLADTVGHADPRMVASLFRETANVCGLVPLAAHFHDTRGMGLANVMAALDVGVRRFDASLGGLGGCPFAPGATGNIATEDCAHMMERLGLRTGIILDDLLELRRELERWLPEDPLDGRLLGAGPVPYGFDQCV